MIDAFRLFHGTTLNAANDIVVDGFEAGEPDLAVSDVAERHGLAADDLWKILEDEPQFYLTGGERETDVSFTPSFDSAAHSWAQRASEARREALWAAWMYMHPDRLEPFHWNLDGQAWVMAHMVEDEPVVVGIEVTADELVEWGAVAVINGHRRNLAEVLFLLDGESLPEVALPSGLWFPATDLIVTTVPRQIEPSVYSYLLGVDQAHFTRLAQAGELGVEGVGQARAFAATAWWALETVTEVLAQRDRPVSWREFCACLG